jgi:hypothetical protein
MPSNEGSAENQATGVSDEGVSFGGGGGMMDWSWIGDMVDSGVSNFHAETLNKQRQRGYDPCTFAASIEEGWYTNMGPKWWRANSAARKVGMALNRAINEAIRGRGVSKPSKYAPAIPLWKYLIDQVGIEALLPEETIGASVAIAIATGKPALVRAFQEKFVKDHLPTGSTIADARIDQRRRGLPLDDNIYLYGPGIKKNPSGPLGSSERNRAISAGRYSGPGTVALVEAWVGEVIERVVPAGFLSARQRLEALVGSWRGSSEWGVWKQGDGFEAASQLGFLDEFRVRMWREFEEAQVQCEHQRQRDFSYRESLVSGALETERIRASRWWVASAALAAAAAFRGMNDP